MEDCKPLFGHLEENDSESDSVQPEFPPGMAPKMLKMVKVLNDLESKIEPLISKPHHEILNKLSPLERAKVGLMEVYTINSLYWVLMRTSGEDVDSTLRDDYKVEMGRLKETQSRLAEIEAGSRKQLLNVQAASRFIHHGLGISRRLGEEETVDENGMEQDSSFASRELGRGHMKTSHDEKSRYQENEVVVEQDYTNNIRYEEEEKVEQDYQDNHVGNPVALNKIQKKKMKVKPGVNLSASDISAFLDTARGRIDYKIDDSDSSKKGRNWYEQGWT